GRSGGGDGGRIIYASMALPPGGRRVARGRNDGEVELLDWPGGDGRTLRPPLEGEKAERPRTRALAFSPDGKLLAAGSGISGFVDDPREEWRGRRGGGGLYEAGGGGAAPAPPAPHRRDVGAGGVPAGPPAAFVARRRPRR